MALVLLASKDPASLEGLAGGLAKRDGIELIHVDSGKEALEKIKKNRVDVLVTGVELADEEPLSLVGELMRKHPMINCAMVSSLSPGDFHENTEGLGVFMQLPLHPGEKEAGKMLEILDSINALLSA